MTRQPAQVVQRIKEVLESEYQPERIILFGSHVSGEAREDSDIDLLIVKETDALFFSGWRKSASSSRPIGKGFLSIRSF